MCIYIYTTMPCNTILIQLPRLKTTFRQKFCLKHHVRLPKPARACDLQGAKRFSRSSPKPSCPSSFLPQSHQSPAVVLAAEKSPPKAREVKPGVTKGLELVNLVDPDFLGDIRW